MGYTVGTVRRWDLGGVTTTSSAVAERLAVAGTARSDLSEGRATLHESWDGVAADAVLDAAAGEEAHLGRLEDGLEELTDVLARAAAALGPAVQSVRDRIADAEAAGLVVGEDSVGPAPGRDDITQDTVDGHVEALGMALDTVRSLDEHYGREIDSIAALLHRAIPPEVDRAPIPGASDPWPGIAATGALGAMSEGFPRLADELDPRTHGQHVANPAPDGVGRLTAGVARGLGKLAGPLGAALTVREGMEEYVAGETTVTEAILETGGALGGGFVGGAAAGALAGSFLGPGGAIVGGGIGAALGAWAGEETLDKIHEYLAGDTDSTEGQNKNVN